MTSLQLYISLEAIALIYLTYLVIRNWSRIRSLFKPVLVIRSREGDLHFVRWCLYENDRVRIYLHKILKADKDIHCHNHPWTLWNMILWGSYIQHFHTESKNEIQTLTVYPGQKFVYEKTDYHRIEKIMHGPVWSINLCLGEHDQDWGYWVDNRHVQHQTYRDMKRKGKFGYSKK